MNNEMWSQKPLIEELSETTEFCILDEATPKNKRINAKTLLDAKANVSDLNNVDNTSDLNKPISTAQQIALDLKAPKANAKFTGTMTLNGYPVSTNDLNGTNYVMVYGIGTPTENAAELQAAYNEAKKMPRYLGAFASTNTIGTFYSNQTFEVDGTYYMFTSNIVNNAINSGTFIEVDGLQAKSVRTTLIVAPGEYIFGNDKFLMDSSNIHVVSLTGNSDVVIDGVIITTSSLLSGIKCNVHGIEVRNVVTNSLTQVKNCDCKDTTITISILYPGSKLEFESCHAGDDSFSISSDNYSNEPLIFDKCTSKNRSFGYAGTGTYQICTDCTGEDDCFGNVIDGCVGIYNRCVGKNNCFGGNDENMSAENASFYYCRAGVNSGLPDGQVHLYCIENNVALPN